MGCGGSKEVIKSVEAPPPQPQPATLRPPTRAVDPPRQSDQRPPPGPATRGPKPTTRRVDNDTVDFVEFKDDEKNVVETMLESNKGLRMAEINFHDLKLSKIIGAGAFGEVIKGTYCGTPVVVKRMLRNKITEDNLRMFGEEIQLMMNLRHPNIVQVRASYIGVEWGDCVQGICV